MRRERLDVCVFTAMPTLFPFIRYVDMDETGDMAVLPPAFPQSWSHDVALLGWITCFFIHTSSLPPRLLL